MYQIYHLSLVDVKSAILYLLSFPVLWRGLVPLVSASRQSGGIEVQLEEILWQVCLLATILLARKRVVGWSSFNLCPPASVKISSPSVGNEARCYYALARCQQHHLYTGGISLQYSEHPFWVIYIFLNKFAFKLV